MCAFCLVCLPPPASRKSACNLVRSLSGRSSCYDVDHTQSNVPSYQARMDVGAGDPNPATRLLLAFPTIFHEWMLDDVIRLPGYAQTVISSFRSPQSLISISPDPLSPETSNRANTPKFAAETRFNWVISHKRLKQVDRSVCRLNGMSLEVGSARRADRGAARLDSGGFDRVQTNKPLIPAKQLHCLGHGHILHICSKGKPSPHLKGKHQEKHFRCLRC